MVAVIMMIMNGMKVGGIIKSVMEKENIIGRMAENMRGNGKMIKKMEKENINGRMEIVMKVNNDRKKSIGRAFVLMILFLFLLIISHFYIAFYFSFLYF